MEIKGVYPAMVTPLTPDESIDTAGMRNVVRYCIAGGVHGLLVLGSTGEFPAMTDTMRQTAIETVLDEAHGKVPVLVGCGDTGTRKTIAQVRAAARTAASGVLVALPYYFPMDQVAVMRHYRMVADASELPVVLYNFPQMTKITIAADTLSQLAAHPNIIGVKDSAGDFVAMQHYVDVTAGAAFAVISGSPALGLSGYQLGVKAGIFAGGSLVPKLCADVYNMFVKGDLESAIALQKKVSLLMLVDGFGPAAAVIKFGLHKLGICGPTAAAPYCLAKGQEEKVLRWMERLGVEVKKPISTRRS